MNQILKTPPKMSLIYIYKSILTLSILTLVITAIYVIYYSYKLNKETTLLDIARQSYSISRLYSSATIVDEHSNKIIPFIMGSLEIPSINLKLPIISKMDDELLKLSACRFYGPERISSGNICIAGHNLDNGKLFSNVPKLQIGEKIIFVDWTQSTYVYTIYMKYEISSNDTSCTSQITEGKTEITLVTCNNFTGKRIIIKAK